MPAPDRTPSGYRQYDEQVLDRLAFIARAKQLGCSLDEVSELSVAWEGGKCGPVQDRLRTLLPSWLGCRRPSRTAAASSLSPSPWTDEESAWR
jgi:DNA-binding transcriptional MerR regulator